MKKIIPPIVVLMLGFSTAAFAIPIVDAYPGANVGMVSDSMSVNFTLSEFSNSSIDLSAISAAIADDIDIPISYLAISGLPMTPGHRPPILPGIGDSPPNSVPEPANLLLFGTGLIVLAGLGRRNIKK